MPESGELPQELAEKFGKPLLTRAGMRRRVAATYVRIGADRDRRERYRTRALFGQPTTAGQLPRLPGMRYPVRTSRREISGAVSAGKG